ncbi:MAG: WD40 repeat domain-containing serine/threonine-protein kinase, partial [Cyanobacteriota bacterium]|nr:WD40 repeat domain-containing serine/threonine-protein kinase [Cyanobacteriota bacterium]
PERRDCRFRLAAYNWMIQTQELADWGAFSEAKIRELLVDILPTLAFIHSHNIIHRDLKPENIIRRKIDGKLVLVDFGVAKHSPNLFQPATGTMAGTIGYAPLEQIRGGKAYPASDLYSLGVTCIYLITQVPPHELFDSFSGELVWRSHLVKHQTSISQELSQILDKLLQDLVQNRYQNAQEVLKNVTQLDSQSSWNCCQLETTPLEIIVHAEIEAEKTAITFQKDWIELALASQIHRTSFSSLMESQSIKIIPNAPAQSHTGLSLKPEEYREKLLEESSIKLSPEIKYLKGHSGEITSIAVGHHGYVLASGSHDCSVRLWNLKTGQLLHRFLGHQDIVNSIAMSPNGHRLVSGSSDQTILAWNLKNGRIADRFFSHSGSPYSHRGGVFSVAYSPDGVIIASGSEDRSVKLWNQRNGELLYRLCEHLDGVVCVTFTQPDPDLFTFKMNSKPRPQSSLFASGSLDGLIKIWKFGQLKSLITLIGHSAPVYTLTFSPNRKMLVSGSGDRTIKLWNFYTGETLNTLKGHEDEITSIAISPDGQLLASASREGHVKLWDISDRHPLGRLLETLVAYPPVAFTPDSQTLITGGEKGEILVRQFK